MFCNSFPMRENGILPLSLEDQGLRCTTSGLVCTSCTRGVQGNATIGLVVQQTAEILGLIIIYVLQFISYA